MTLGSLSVSGNIGMRLGGNIPSSNVTFMPYPMVSWKKFDTIEFIESVLTDVNSGVEKPGGNNL